MDNPGKVNVSSGLPDLSRLSVAGAGRAGTSRSDWLPLAGQVAEVAPVSRSSGTGIGLLALLAVRVPPVSVPHCMRFVSEYPMTVAGKVRKYLMREAMAAGLG